MIVCALLVAGMANADCSKILNTMSRFRGTIVSVKRLPPDAEANDAALIEHDAKFVVAVNIEHGDTVTFALRSPSRTFQSKRLVGQTFDLEAERSDCNGRFFQYITLRRQRPSSTIEPFDGWLEVGHTYRAKTTQTADGPALAKSLDSPMHHDSTIRFLNADDWPPNGHEIVFEIVALHVERLGDEWEFVSEYDARIIPGR